MKCMKLDLRFSQQRDRLWRPVDHMALHISNPLLGSPVLPHPCGSVLSKLGLP
jgi:hypothetical protein